MWYAIAFAGGLVVGFLAFRVYWNKEIAAGKSLLSQVVSRVQTKIGK